MTSWTEKARRMEVRRKIGSRSLHDPAGPVALPRGPQYLMAHACFQCRLSFKRAIRKDGTPSPCPTCRNPLSEMGRGFRAPLRRNLDGWKAVELLYQAGFRFPSTTRRATPSLPLKSREVAKFIADNPLHPYRVGAT